MLSRAAIPNAPTISIDDAMHALGPFESNAELAVAVSGGPDSMALALLLHDWAQRYGHQVRAITVDHGLRPESATEAQHVAGWMRAKGIPHTVLTLTDRPRGSSIQEKARAARYHALKDYCESHHIVHLLTGHHLNDQLETVAFRALRQSGVAGLSGMSAKRSLGSVQLLRPLLIFEKSDLIAWLEAHQQPYLTDPSNESMAYSRNSVRAQLTGETMLCASLDATIPSIAAARMSLEKLTAHHMVKHVTLNQHGLALVQRHGFLSLPHLIQRKMLERLLTCVSGNAEPVRGEKLEALRMSLESLCVAKTLHGVVITPHNDHIVCYREAARMAPAVTVKAPRTYWDGRYALKTGSLMINNLILGPLGESGTTHLLQEYPDAVAMLPKQAVPTLPAVWQGDRLLATPTLDYYAADDLGSALRTQSQLVHTPIKPLAGTQFFPILS